MQGRLQREYVLCLKGASEEARVAIMLESGIENVLLFESSCFLVGVTESGCVCAMCCILLLHV